MSYRVLYSFAGGSDGANPYGPLINVSGTLYGSTQGGGSSNHGTVYSVSTTGAETVLHNFAGGSDGAAPQGALINVNGTLFGTTSNGGSFSDGTVFNVSTATFDEKVLYSFAVAPTENTLWRAWSTFVASFTAPRPEVARRKMGSFTALA
jgi:uncharacterized repeat protein (TIGR03803 family)